jgi:hypothetical protein
VARGLRIDVAGLAEMGADLQRLAPPGLRHVVRDSLRGTGGEALAAEMRNRAPRRTGHLHDNINVHNQPGDDVLVGYQGGFSGGAVVNAREQRGAWVESGTRPHKIKAKRAEALFFAGRAVEEVVHPGMRGQGVARKSIKAAEWEVMADIVDKIDKRLAGGSGGG